MLTLTFQVASHDAVVASNSASVSGSSRNARIYTDPITLEKSTSAFQIFVSESESTGTVDRRCSSFRLQSESRPALAVAVTRMFRGPFVPGPEAVTVTATGHRHSESEAQTGKSHRAQFES